MQKPVHAVDKTKFTHLITPTKMYDLEWATLATITIYSYMLNKYLFFKSKGNEYYESEVQIGLFLNLTSKSVQRAIKLLKEHSFLDYKLVHKGTSFVNVYVVNDVFGLYSENKTNTNSHYARLEEQECDEPF